MLTVDLPLYCVSHRKIGGTESAIYNLSTALALNFELNLYTDDTQKLSPDYLRSLADNKIPIYTNSLMPILRRKSRFLQEFAFSRTVSTADWTVYPNYFAPGRRSGRVASILHDIQYKTLPHLHSTSRKIWLDAYLPRMLKSVDVAVVISQFEKEKVAEHFGPELGDKCHVVYNSIDFDRFSYVDALPLVTPTPSYVLAVAHRFPHKNIDTLIKAFYALPQSNDDISLVLVGKLSDQNSKLLKEIDSEGRRYVVFNFVSDAELGELYRKAKLFAHPSLYEGFGMPPVEALGLGTPTIVSKVASMPEVTMGLAEYVEDPLNVEEWTSKIGAALLNPNGVSQNAAHTVRDRYSPQRISKQLKILLG
jgi:glycosyltransferase involved in cell wall biosynthesis